ncbi:hypothetical protein [Mesorhizobium sp. M0578]
MSLAWLGHQQVDAKIDTRNFPRYENVSDCALFLGRSGCAV